MLCDLCLRETGSDSGLHADCFKYLLQKQMEGCCVCHDLTRGGCTLRRGRSALWEWYHPDCHAKWQIDIDNYKQSAKTQAGLFTKSATKKTG